ncbi:MAG: hypothetical protein QME81_01285 [bacterium]|nr:hypothetical protein [bacterium]
MDEHQWYPPLFPLLMAHLPKSVFDRYSHWVAISIDLLRMVLLLAVTFWLSGSDLYAVGVAGLIYATTPLLISYNIQLNPRGLGALFLDGLIILLLWRYFLDGPVWIWGPIILLAGSILLTHKMTTQLFWFLCLGGGLLTMDWQFLFLIPASILMALLLSKGFYWKVLLAHWDIVTFWNRNWRWLQAHPIKESPIYGKTGYETPTKFHKKSLPGILRHLSYLWGYHPGIWILCVLILGVAILGKGDIITSSSGVFWWMVFTLFFVLVTVFVPSLKCLGSGYFYLYNAAVPTALFWGLSIGSKEAVLPFWLGLFIAVAAGLFNILLFYRKLLASKIQKADPHFEKVLDYLKTAPKGVVMCLPPQWYDVVAYKTGQPVLYGGHGYGFKLLEPVFPRLLLSIQEIVQQYQVCYLITLEDYLPKNFLADLTSESVSNFGHYMVFCMAKKEG